ncbi:MAG: cytochrome c [Acidobacteriia bacterium]|nr:cytochrome c [Terriglobia bacterium]
MKYALLLLAITTLTPAQDLGKQGEAVFSKSCATGYCHGARGTNGGAPRLAARGFDQEFIGGTVARGIPGTAMPAFATTLSRADLTAVVAYVASLNGIASPTIAGSGGPPVPAAAKLTADAARGRTLFSDAVRGFGRCSTCHEIGGLGIPVATPIAKVPADVAALKILATPQVSTATLGAESMPALVVSKKANAVIFYDLTTPPPVLRTEASASIQTRDGSTWRHASVISAYSDAELAAILTYLRAVVKL